MKPRPVDTAWVSSGGTEGRVVALALGLGVAGALLLLPWGAAPAATTLGALPVWAVLPVLLVAGSFVVHVRIGREAHEISARELGLVVGLALVPPGVYGFAHVLLSTLPLLWRRMAWLKVAFNTGLFAAEAGAVVLTYRVLLGDAPPISLRGVAATYASVIVMDLLGAGAVEAVIRLRSTGDQAPGGHRRLPVLTVGLVAALVSASLALLALVLLAREPAALPLLAVPMAALAAAYRSHVRLTEGHDRLAVLYAFTRASGRALADDDVSQVVLARTRELMSAELAELHLLARDALPAVSLRCREGGDEVLTGQVGQWWSPALLGRAVHRRAGDSGPGPADALAAPLYEDGAVTGALVVVDRMGDTSTFAVNDAEVFAALAATAGVSLHNAGLVARLRAEAVVREHEARHDALTGLLNRAGLVEAMAGTPGPYGVVVLDLDGFRDVNDALGHDTGDELLVAIAGRLVHEVPGALVARLSGKEYALAVPGTDHVGLAGQARRALERGPLALRQVDLQVSATTGSVATPAEGAHPTLLLRRADLAKNRARLAGDDHADFRPVDETASRDRLALVGDLRWALETGDLEVWYQPQLDLHTDRVGTVEALVRWTHPALGPLSPEMFVPLAERSGLIDQLTEFVLAEALRTAAQWRAAGLLDSVAVNLSARSIRPSLPGLLSEALARAGLEPGALVLELTETAVVSDAARAAEVLRELADLGLAISLDDFGTGYSSLSYLRQLPLTEVKIDKSFVLGMTLDPQDAAVVRSTISLAHELGLRVVAEGVEDEASLAALRALDCDLVQGYHLSRPASARALQPWLAARAALVPAPRNAQPAAPAGRFSPRA